MVKAILPEPGRTFSEYSLLTGHASKECQIAKVSIKTNLAGVMLKIPFLSAAMRSVTGYEMALALGKEGGLGVLPSRLSVEEQVEIVKKIKQYDMNFVENPEKAENTATIAEVIQLVNEHGHSKIPMVDRNNTFLGIFDYEHFLKSDEPVESATQAMIPRQNIMCCSKPDISVTEAKQIIEQNGEDYLVVLDEQGRLIKIAFKKDTESIPVAIAIDTYPGWQDRVRKNIEAGADVIVIDTSDAYSAWVDEVITEYKRMQTGVPICAGNVVTYESAYNLMEMGADIVKVGMSSGSICTTQREKSVGRAPMTALIEVDKARQDFLRKTGRYVPVIIDGGISTPADMVIALTVADAMMFGNWMNKSYEAAGEKLDKNGKETTTDIVAVVTYGEGSERAQNIGRYGHSKKSFFAEGVEGRVSYEGRLKPRLKKAIKRIKAAMVNVGAMNLEEFKQKAVLELNSPHTSQVVSTTHNVEVSE